MARVPRRRKLAFMPRRQNSGRRMQKIVWLGSPHFADRLKECGFEDMRIMDARPGRIYAWADIAREAGFEPDILVVAENGSPPFVLGMENFPCATIFYSSTSHIHSWHGLYAQGFDVCIVAQGGHVERFAGPFLDQAHVWFMPLCAPDPDGEPVPGMAERACDLLLVPGTDSRKFYADITAHIDNAATRAGNDAEAFRQARIVLYHGGPRPGLGAEIFRSMASGACLVAPRMGQGMENLFVDGEHYVGYRPDDAGDAAYRVNYLLEHPDLVAHIGRCGQEAVDAAHCASHRAWEFTDHIFNLASQDMAGSIAARRQKADAIRRQCLAVPYLLFERGVKTQGAAFAAAAQGKFGLEGIED